jgi:hypothetical protein
VTDLLELRALVEAAPDGIGRDGSWLVLRALPAVWVGNATARAHTDYVVVEASATVGAPSGDATGVPTGAAYRIVAVGTVEHDLARGPDGRWQVVAGPRATGR